MITRHPNSGIAPESLHTRFKVACAKTKSKMAPEIIAFIEKRVSELENETTYQQ